MVIHGDCLDELRRMPDASIDSLVTDPPAGISFMGKAWDGDRGGRDAWVNWMTGVMTEVARVLKPGAHGLVWALPRTSHWTATALENAGFEIRDVITHLFGTGFPKSLDVSKAIDRAAGAERETLGVSLNDRPKSQVKGGRAFDRGLDSGQEHEPLTMTAPATDAARQWSGWGTALKPASEHWILIRKPLGEKTVAANVLEHGAGGINVDAGRIGTAEFIGRHSTEGAPQAPGWGTKTRNTDGSPLGRFPANVVLSHSPECKVVGTKTVGSGDIKNARHQRSDKAQASWKNVSKGGGIAPDSYGTETVEAWECAPECAVRMLDEQSGILHPSGNTNSGLGKGGKTSSFGIGEGTYGQSTDYKDRGGASRFFYCAKASKSDRGIDNKHPTVKSSALMEYLIRLITPPNGIVLDPFAGSGSTGVAALRSGFRFVGIERELEYVEIANRRLEQAKS